MMVSANRLLFRVIFVLFSLLILCSSTSSLSSSISDTTPLAFCWEFLESNTSVIAYFGYTNDARTVTIFPTGISNEFEIYALHQNNKTMNRNIMFNSTTEPETIFYPGDHFLVSAAIIESIHLQSRDIDSLENTELNELAPQSDALDDSSIPKLSISWYLSARIVSLNTSNQLQECPIDQSVNLSLTFLDSTSTNSTSDLSMWLENYLLDLLQLDDSRINVSLLNTSDSSQKRQTLSATLDVLIQINPSNQSSVDSYSAFKIAYDLQYLLLNNQTIKDDLENELEGTLLMQSIKAATQLTPTIPIVVPAREVPELPPATTGSMTAILVISIVLSLLILGVVIAVAFGYCVGDDYPFMENDRSENKRFST